VEAIVVGVYDSEPNAMLIKRAQRTLFD